MSIIEDFEEIRQLIGRIGSFDSRRSIKKADDTAYYQLAEADLKLEKFSKQIQSLQTKLQQAKEGLEFYGEESNHHARTIGYGDNAKNRMSKIEEDEGRKARETLEIINKDFQDEPTKKD